MSRRSMRTPPGGSADRVGVSSIEATASSSRQRALRSRAFRWRPDITRTMSLSAASTLRVPLFRGIGKQLAQFSRFARPAWHSTPPGSACRAARLWIRLQGVFAETAGQTQKSVHHNLALRIEIEWRQASQKDSAVPLRAKSRIKHSNHSPVGTRPDETPARLRQGYSRISHNDFSKAIPPTRFHVSASGSHENIAHWRERNFVNHDKRATGPCDVDPLPHAHRGTQNA